MEAKEISKNPEVMLVAQTERLLDINKNMGKQESMLSTELSNIQSISENQPIKNNGYRIHRDSITLTLKDVIIQQAMQAANQLIRIKIVSAKIRINIPLVATDCRRPFILLHLSTLNKRWCS